MEKSKINYLPIAIGLIIVLGFFSYDYKSKYKKEHSIVESQKIELIEASKTIERYKLDLSKSKDEIASLKKNSDIETLKIVRKDGSTIEKSRIRTSEESNKSNKELLTKKETNDKFNEFNKTMNEDIKREAKTTESKETSKTSNFKYVLIGTGVVVAVPVVVKVIIPFIKALIKKDK